MRLFIIFFNGHLSAVSVIDSKRIKMTWQGKTSTKLVPSQTPFRTSHQRCSVKKIFLKIYKIPQKNTCVGVCFFNFIRKRLQHRCFPVKFAKFLGRTILKNICECLLLPFLGFTKLNLNVFLWLSWRHRFLYNNIMNCEEHVPPL